MARTFNGSTQFCERASAVRATLPLTISCWIYPTTVSVFQVAAAISHATSAVVGDLFRLMIYNTNVIECASFVGTTATVATTSGTISANAWHHIAATFSSASGQYAWLNGTKGTNGGNSRTPATADTTSIGREVTNNTQYFPFAGRIAEVAFYSVVLDDAEIVAMNRGYTPLEIRPASLVAYYPLGGHYGQFDLDRWKNRYDLTAYNSPTWADHPRVIYPGPSFAPIKATVASSTKYWTFARQATRIVGGGIGT